MTGLKGSFYHIKLVFAPVQRGLLAAHYDIGGLASYEQLHLGYVNVILTLVSSSLLNITTMTVPRGFFVQTLSWDSL